MMHEFHGEVKEGTDASSGIAFTLFSGGSVTEYTLQSDERLVITDVLVVSENAGLVGVHVDSDAAGRRVVQGSVAAGGGIAHHFTTPHFCPGNTVPKLFAPAGVACGMINGYVQKSST